MADESQTETIRMVQMMAHGYLIDLLLATQFAQHPRPGEAADNLLKLVEATAQPMSVSGLSSVAGEAVAQAFHDSVVGHIRRAKAMASGDPLPAEPGSAGGASIREH